MTNPTNIPSITYLDLLRILSNGLLLKQYVLRLTNLITNKQYLQAVKMVDNPEFIKRQPNTMKRFLRRQFEIVPEEYVIARFYPYISIINDSIKQTRIYTTWRKDLLLEWWEPLPDERSITNNTSNVICWGELRKSIWIPMYTFFNARMARYS